MKLERAIENLTAGREDCGMIPEEEFTPTLDLAREGLAAIQSFRAHKQEWVLKKLSGETED